MDHYLRSQYQNAQIAFAKGDFDLSIKIFSDLIIEYPNIPELN